MTIKRNIHIMALPLQNNTGILPAAYMNLKTYYECKGKYPNQWHWPKPILNRYTFELLMSEIHKYPPTILALGGYIWNIDLCYRVAIEVKKHWPECVVIAGGPQPEYLYDQDYFKKNPYIDIVIPFDGEMPLTDIMDQMSVQRINLDECANIVYPTPFGWNHSIKQLSAKEFKWEQSPIIAQKEIIHEYITEYKKKGLRIEAFIDTTRGCPYKCVFCDWGGNSQTKLRQKPMDQVKAEAEFLCDVGVDHVYFTDANFGILPRDLDIAKIYVEQKKKTGYPKNIILLNAKNNQDRVTQIHEVLFSVKIDGRFVISLQDFNAEVRDNIFRKDIPLEDQLSMYHKVGGKKGVKDYAIEIIGILGLPGQSLSTLMKDVDIVVGHNIMFPFYNNWLLLPNSPAADPEYMKKWKIKVKRTPSIATYAVAKKEHVTDNFGGATVVTSRDGIASDVVVETSSFDIHEFVKMRNFTSVMTSTYSTGLLRIIGYGIHKFKGVSYSDFYKAIFDEFFLTCSMPVREFRNYTEDQLSDVLLSDEQKYLEFDSPWLATKFPFLLPNQVWWRLHVMWYSENIYKDLRYWLIEKGWYDETIEDLIVFNENLLITPSYDPTVGRTWTTKYDWLKWYNDISVNSIKEVVLIDPKQEETTYFTKQNTVTFFNHTMDIEWHKWDNTADKLLEYFYKTCFGTKTEILFTEIEIR